MTVRPTGGQWFKAFPEIYKRACGKLIEAFPARDRPKIGDGKVPQLGRRAPPEKAARRRDTGYSQARRSGPASSAVSSRKGSIP